MQENNNNKTIETNESELSYAMEDVDLLVAYLAKTGKTIPPELLSYLVESKHFGPIDSWTAAQEIKFWQTLNEVTAMIKPVTISSLKAFATQLDYAYGEKKPQKKGLLRNTLFGYGFFAFAAVFSIMFLQLYLLVGQDVLSKSQELFVERNEVRQSIKLKEIAASKLDEATTILKSTLISKSNKSDPGSAENKISTPDNLSTPESDRVYYRNVLEKDEDYQLLKAKEKLLDQEFDANRTILFEWNLVWRLGIPPQPELSLYDNHRYNSAISQLEMEIKELETTEVDSMSTPNPEAIDKLKTDLKDIEMQKSLHMSRDLYFRAGLSAMFVINLLQYYLLPMLYGCLGALSMVLRSLCKSIKDETFSSSFSLDYNMRLLLGAVSGMASGLFFGDNGLVDDPGFSLMLVAFVIGYNVEVLFTLVDKIANKITSAPQRSTDTPESDKQAS